MYGKIFEEIYHSTLMNFGGDTAYVFISMVVLSDEDGVIKHTCESLSRMICKEVDSVRQAIANLENPDPQSNLKAHEGRRIVPLSWLLEDQTRGWLVVNKVHYRDIRDKDERREYMRDYMRKYRNKNNGVNSGKPEVNNGKSELAELANTDTDTDTDTKQTRAFARFDLFWEAYPRKKSKGVARKIWKRLKPDEQLHNRILNALELAKKSESWLKERGKFIPYPGTWLNAEGWDDEHATTENSRWEGGV